MKRMTLVLLVLLAGAVSSAPADYVLIIANLGKKEPVAMPGQPPLPVLPGAGARQGGISNFQPPPPGTQPGAPTDNQPFPPPGAPTGPAAAPFDPDKVPLMILAIVEVERKITARQAALLRMGGSPFPSPVPFRVGGLEGKCQLANTSISTVAVLHPNDKPTPTLREVYAQKLKALTDSTTPLTADQWVDLAEWSLGHGMLDHFKAHMEKAAAIDKNAPKVDGYLKMKAALAKPVAAVDAAGPWRLQLLSTRYVTTTTDHYAILSNDSPATKSRAPRLEDALQSYYYWFALHGLQLPVPGKRLVVILTSDPKEFKHLHAVLDSTPVVSDSFYARRENIAVFSTRRLDDSYDRLEKMAAPLWGQGFDREGLLKGKGFPPRLALTPSGRRQIQDAMTYALLLKVMELDAEIAGTGHGATRQLLYASGFLPPTVAAPEWVQFGLSTFFETTPGSPWPTVGLPSFMYGPLFKEFITAKKLPPNGLDLLKEVVTDGFFREPTSYLSQTREASLRKARATAWSLCHFLVRKRLDGLQRYFAELAKMPRDMALSERDLWVAFAAAFNAVDATGQPDESALRTLADDWDKDMAIEHYDNREIDLMRTIRLAYQQAATMHAGTPTGPPAAPQPGRAGQQRGPGVN